MSRRDSERDVERPRYYSTYWINIARQESGKNGGPSVLAEDLIEDEEDLEEDFLPEPPVVTPPPNSITPIRPATPPAPKKAKPPEPRTLSSLADLAELGFGKDIEQPQDLAIGDDEDTESIISRIESGFDDDDDEQDEDVLPDEEEAASLEALEDEEWADDEEDEDSELGPRRRTVPRPKPPRRPAPRRTREF